MDLPQKFRSKYGVYDIQINGVKIKASLVDPSHPSLETVIAEFKSQIETDLPVVGVDFKTPDRYTNPVLLLLYARDRCLIIQLSLVCRRFPKCLGLFLSDNSICFVGFKIDEYFNSIRTEAKYFNSIKTSKCPPYDSGLTGKGAEIRRLAAGVLKQPPLAECSDVFELASKSGLCKDMKMPRETNKPSSWSAKAFTEEEVVYAVHDAYYCYEMGKKLLTML